MRMLIVFGWILLALGMSPARKEVELGFGPQIDVIFYRASRRLEKIGEKQIFKVPSMNHSLAKTALAMREIMHGEAVSSLLPILEQAKKDYEKNHFATFLQAILLDRAKDTQKANRSFEEFLIKGQAYTEFEEPFLKWAEFHRLRRSVYELLKQRRVPFKGREKEIKIEMRNPFGEFIQFAANPRRRDASFVLLFAILIVGCGVMLFFSSLLGYEFTGPFSWNLPNLYFILIISYGLWLTDLAVGLPFGWSRYTVVPILLGSGLAFFVISGLVSHWIERTRPLEEGYRRCPHCRAVIHKLLTQCPECRRQITEMGS
jgi:hypothetical protein